MRCSHAAKSGTELLPPRFSASTSFCFPLPLPLLVFCSPSCPYSFHLSCFSTHHFQLCDPAFPLSAVSPPPFLFPSLSSLFPSSFTFSACLSVLPYVYLSHSLTLFSTASIFPSLCQSSLPLYLRLAFPSPTIALFRCASSISSSSLHHLVNSIGGHRKSRWVVRGCHLS